MPMNLADLKILALDCQATGANPQKGHLLEIGWIQTCAAGAVNPETLTASAYQIALPVDVDIPPAVQRITGIVDDPQITIAYDQWDNIPAVADHKGSGFAVISAAVQEIYPEALVVPSLLAATTDTRHYIDLADNQYRFHGVIMATRQVKSIHGTDEYIDVDSYEKSIAVALQMMTIGSR